MRISPISFMAKSRPLNNTASLYQASRKPQEAKKDTFTKSQNVTPAKSAVLVTPKSERTCKNIATATSLICAAISGASGKAEPFSGVAWALRGTQALMFVLMSIEMDIPVPVAFTYAATEYMSGAYLGCEGSKDLVVLAGTVSDVLSGGTATPVSEGAVRGINAGISAAITKKMGNGFVKQVKSGHMNGLDQAIRLSSYLAGRLIMGYNRTKGMSGGSEIDKVKSVFEKGFQTNSIGDLNNVDKVKAVLSSIPDAHKDFSAEIIQHIISRDLSKGTLLFLEQMLGYKIKESVINYKMKKQFNVGFKFDEETKKEAIKQALFDSFITCAVYDLFDIAQNALISKEAVDTVIEISENIHNYPEVYKVFEEYQDELMKNYNLGKISSDAFLNQFKNRTFLYNISNLTGQKAKQFAREWMRKENTAKNKQKAQQVAKIQQEDAKTSQYEKASDELSARNADVIKSASESSQKIKQNLSKVNAFGYSKIAGYDEEKAFLKAYLNSLSSVDSCDSDDLLNSVLFFGPRGNGKTTFASALSEEFGCRFRKMDTTSNKQKALTRLQKELGKAKEHWVNNQRNSIILIDECTAFMNKAQNPEEEEINSQIAELMKDSSSKYHAMLFMTTNYPAKLDEIFIDGEIIPLCVPLNPPDKTNATAVFKYYTENCDVDIEQIVDEFEKQCCEQNARYSNGQIKNIIELTKLQNDGKITTQGVINAIRHTRPEVLENDIKSFDGDKKFLMGND